MSNMSQFQHYGPRHLVVQLRPDISLPPTPTNPIPMPFVPQTRPSFPFHSSFPGHSYRPDPSRDYNFYQPPINIPPSRICLPPARDNSSYIHTQQTPFYINSQQSQPPPLPPRSNRPVERRTQQHTNSLYQNGAFLEAMHPHRTNIPVFPGCGMTSDFEGFGYTRIIASPPKIPEHRIEDIPLWENVPVVHLPPDVFRFVCSRIDDMPASGTTRNWVDLATRARFPLDIQYSSNHTSQLLEVWRPRLSVLLEKLEEMDCKELVSEIIEKLKTCRPAEFFCQPSIPSHMLYPRTTSIPPPNCDYFRSNSTGLASKVHGFTGTRSPSPSSSYTTYSPSPPPEEPEVKPEIFVSFHPNDEDLAKEIIRQIKLLNIPVSSNLDLPPGANELTEITDWVDSCKKVIGVISPDYLDDGMPLYEGMMGIKKSITGKKRTFIPFLAKPTNNLPGYFSSLKPIKWTDENKWQSLKLALKRK